MERTEDLKRCPFCGGRATIGTAGKVTAYRYVSCIRCGGQTRLYNNEAEAIGAWNDRYTDANT